MIRYIVRNENEIALRFLFNICLGRRFEPVADNEATKFDHSWEAEAKAAAFGMRHGTFTIDHIEEALTDS